MQDNLSNRIYAATFENGATHLTEAEQNALFSLITKGCRVNTKNKISRRLELPLSLWNDYGIYKRVTFDEKGIYYICGQSWTDEMRVLRECVLDI
jgi:hypothetical protein